MKLKRLFILLICTIILAFQPMPVTAASSGISIYVNNTRLPDNTVSASNGIIYAAAAELAQYLGGSFRFSEDTLSGTIAVGQQELAYYLNDSTMCCNGKYIKAEAPMKIINNRIMVPAIFTADKLGAAKYYDEEREAILLYNPTDSRLVYSVLQGDTLWKISLNFSISIAAIKKNNSITGDMIYAGQKLFIRKLAAPDISIPAYTTGGTTVFSGPGFSYSVKGYLPAGKDITVRGKMGDWYRADTSAGSGYVYYTVTGIRQQLTPPAKSTYFSEEIPVDTSRDTVTYKSYTVISGDSIWSVSQKYGIPDYELAAANGITSTAVLYPGQVLKIPVHAIAQGASASGKYGQVLDWFKQGQYVLPVGKTGKLTDLSSGRSFMVKRTMGASHSDTETLTEQDTQTMKQIFGGSWNWTRRAFILEVDGRRFAVSVSGMPHAGVDSVPLNQNVDGRSGDYGYGPNYDAIAGNGMNGHFDLYFLNGRRHLDGEIDPDHQYSVLKAGGLR